MGLFSSPESTLKKAIKDLKAEGIDGVKKYLTANTLKNLNSFQSWTDHPLVDIITTAVAGNNKEDLLKEKIAGCDWTIVDVLKGKEQAKGVLRFTHADGFSGTINVELIKEDRTWKINSLNSPKFD